MTASGEKAADAAAFAFPPIGYGTFPLKERLVDAIPMAVRCGYRLVDTSDNYGNEESAGRGLSACGAERADVVVVTKFSNPLRTGALACCFEKSRKKLGGVVDVYLLHWPYPFLWREQWRRMEELYFAGRCRAIGVCNFDRPKMEALLKICRVRPAVNQFERHPLFQQCETAAFCREQGVAVMCYSPLARMDARLMQNPVLMDLAAKYGKKVGQIVLRWSVEQGDIPIPASGTEAHIRENFNVFDFQLAQDDMERIDALESGIRIRFDPARRFTVKNKARFLLCRMKQTARKLLVKGGS